MLRRASRLLLLATPLLSLIGAGIAKAENPRVTEVTDFWFSYSEPTTFVAQTFMVEGFNSDPMLWFYDEENNLLASNDDTNGLQSYISLQVPAGRYRLRAGICCNDPNAWRTGNGWNLQYEVNFTGQDVSQGTTTSSSTTTTELTTTTTEPPTTTTSTTTTTEPPATTTTVDATTTTTTSSTTTTTEVSTTTTSTPTTSTSSTTVVAPTTSTTVDATTTTTTTVAPAPVALETLQEINNAVENLSNMDVEDVSVAQIDEILDPAVAENLSPEQVDEVIAVIAEVIDELNDTELLVLAEALTNAPTEVKHAFEAEVNVFDGKFDSYVPTGSTVSVGQRRVLNAVVATLVAAPAVAVSGSSTQRRKI